MDKNDENLDQGFNDAELADIMNEIEGLEKEIEADKPVVAVSAAKENQASEVLEELVEAPVEKVVPISKPKFTEGAPTQASTMDINISGNMVVNLNFCVSGQTVALSLDEKSGLVIEMGSGGKFVLPLGKTAGSKAA